MTDLLETVRELHTSVVTGIEDRTESDLILRDALCTTDYVANSAYYMLWLAVDHFAGGETSLEQVLELWDGILITEDYGETMSLVCGVESDSWVLKTTGMKSSSPIPASSGE